MNTSALRRLHAEATDSPDNSELYRAAMAVFEPLAAFLDAHADDPALAESPTFAALKHAVDSRNAPAQSMGVRPAIVNVSRPSPTA